MSIIDLVRRRYYETPLPRPTLRAISRETGLNVSVVHNTLSGRTRCPTPETVQALARYFELSDSEIQQAAVEAALARVHHRQVAMAERAARDLYLVYCDDGYADAALDDERKAVDRAREIHGVVVVAPVVVDFRRRS